MSKDYKHRLQQVQQQQNKRPRVAGWQWLLAVCLVIGFVAFLQSLRGKNPQEATPEAPAAAHSQSKAQAPLEAKKAAPLSVAVPASAQTEAQQQEAPPKPVDSKSSGVDSKSSAVDSKSGVAEKPKPPKPRFQFYTVLPEKEVIIPESEVKARKQEEKQGKAPTVGEVYMLQIGSFKTMAEADRLKAQLAMLGVEAKIETAQIGTATWNRVKVGPFASMASADKTRGVLRQNNVDSVVQKAIGAAMTQP